MKSRILIVDDHKESARDLRSIFTRNMPWDVDVAYDGSEAITKATQGKPDLVLLDIQLPVLDGFEVLARLKHQSIPTRVIMFSAYHVDIATAVKAIKEGACDYLTKPVHPNKLMEHIERALVTESTINMNLANDATPLLRNLLESVERLTNDKGAREYLTSPHALVEPASNLRSKLAKHWFFVVVAFATAVAAGTWQLVMNLYVYPRDFELNRLRNPSSELQASPTQSPTVPKP